MQTLIFLVAALAVLLLTAGTSLLSARPTELRNHLISLGRLGVFGSTAYMMAEVLQGRLVPDIEHSVMAVSLVLIYSGQARCEVLRQLKRSRSSDRRQQAGMPR